MICKYEMTSRAVKNYINEIRKWLYYATRKSPWKEKWEEGGERGHLVMTFYPGDFGIFFFLNPHHLYFLKTNCLNKLVIDGKISSDSSCVECSVENEKFSFSPLFI